MKLLLEDILQELCSANLCAALGEDCFWDKLPDSPDSCIAVFEYNSESDVPYENDAVHRSVQLVCRESTAISAKAKVTRVYDYIRSTLDETGVMYFNERFTQTSLRQTPFKLDEDDRSRVIYGFNMGITTARDI